MATKAILKAGLEDEDNDVREKAWEARYNLLQKGYISFIDLDN